jgi:predicted RNase H-like HicB family nuclease
MATSTIELTATLVREGDWIVAHCVEVDIASQGRTFEEAIANLGEALELYFEDGPVPEYTRPIVAPVQVRIPA